MKLGLCSKSATQKSKALLLFIFFHITKFHITSLTTFCVPSKLPGICHQADQKNKIAGTNFVFAINAQRWQGSKIVFWSFFLVFVVDENWFRMWFRFVTLPCSTVNVKHESFVEVHGRANDDKRKKSRRFHNATMLIVWVEQFRKNGVKIAYFFWLQLLSIRLCSHFDAKQIWKSMTPNRNQMSMWNLFLYFVCQKKKRKDFEVKMSFYLTQTFALVSGIWVRCELIFMLWDRKSVV